MRFECFNKTENQSAITHISIQDARIKVDVDLETLPKVRDLKIGWEVVVIFSISGFNNN